MPAAGIRAAGITCLPGGPGVLDAADGEALAQSASVVKPGVSANPGQYRYSVLEAQRARVDPTALNFWDLRLFSGDLTGRW